MFYNRIKYLRREKGYTQKHIAAILNVSQATYSKYEKESIIMPVYCIKILSKFYNTSTPKRIRRKNNGGFFDFIYEKAPSGEGAFYTYSFLFPAALTPPESLR